MGVAGKTASSSDSGKQGWGGGTEIVSEDVPIPNQHAGVIIGKGGNTIKDLQQRTGCKVQVSQKDEVVENDTRLVRFPGAPADSRVAFPSPLFIKLAICWCRSCCAAPRSRSLLSRPSSKSS